MNLAHKAIRYLRWKATEIPHRYVLNPIYRLTDARGITSPEQVYSDRYYAKRAKGRHADDAEEYANAIMDVFEPESVIDLGCAIGHYLRPMHEAGVHVRGVDAHSAAIEHSLIPKDQMELADLRDEYDPWQRYDVALCIEVAEHLAEEHADTLVDTIVECAPVVVFTAATPGQGGTHHVNEQPRDYWKRMFIQRGYEYDHKAVEDIRRRVNPDLLDHVADNLFVFREVSHEK